ncbi:hypothetical protein HGRIS_001502 [Hohenbuehelia grisea]|uniref:Uncharacterized protein n=1 Tax=Hohenbuehelia grisea TaxID=104357 RepID=A0ABR3JQU6_9AGAR
MSDTALPFTPQSTPPPLPFEVDDARIDGSDSPDAHGPRNPYHRRSRQGHEFCVRAITSPTQATSTVEFRPI